MTKSKVLLAWGICGTLVLPLGMAWGANRYFFEPETLRIIRGAPFEWHIMMENDVELCGYGLTIDAPVGGDILFDPDTLTFDWTGTGADIGGLDVVVGPEFSPAQNWFGGAAVKRMCPPELAVGTHISVKIYGTISETASFGTHAFWGPHSGNPCDFIDGPGSTFDVPVDTGWIEILHHPFIRGDANADLTVKMDDAIHILQHKFVGGPQPSCMDAADANDDGGVLMNDAIWILQYKFVGGPPPPAPFPDCGLDETPDGLGCNDHPCMTGGYKASGRPTSIRRRNSSTSESIWDVSK